MPHIVLIMKLLYLLLALVIQGSLSYADEEVKTKDDSREDLKNVLELNDDVAKEADWIDMFVIPNSDLFPTSSVAMMAHATNSDKEPEEQVKDIKDMACKIKLAIQSEIANLLAYALSGCDKTKDPELKEKESEHISESNNTRTKRSAESPMDSTKLITRLLKHIKSNNEYQNIAIEKMMTAQEIADKFGIDFSPDAEVLSELAVAANEQATDMSNILKDAIAKNSSQNTIEFVPFEDANDLQLGKSENSYFAYSKIPEQEIADHMNDFASYEYMPQPIQRTPHRHHQHPETQIQSPVHQHQQAPVSHRPNFYDHVYNTPAQVYCPEPVTTTTTIVLPFEEPVMPEPELVGEEFEETVSSKVVVDHDEPGLSTVNHVTTYTLSEKSHFRNPQIEKLPQQMQYSFFLL